MCSNKQPRKVFRGMQVRKQALPSPARSSKEVLHDEVLKSILETTGADLTEKHEHQKCELIQVVDSISGAAIMLNALHIGGQANCVMTDSCYMSPEMMNIIDLCFALGFAVELGIRRSLTGSRRAA